MLGTPLLARWASAHVATTMTGSPGSAHAVGADDIWSHPPCWTEMLSAALRIQTRHSGGGELMLGLLHVWLADNDAHLSHAGLDACVMARPGRCRIVRVELVEQAKEHIWPQRLSTQLQRRQLLSLQVDSRKNTEPQDLTTFVRQHGMSAQLQHMQETSSAVAMCCGIN